MFTSQFLLSDKRLDDQADLTTFLIQTGFLFQESSGFYSFQTLGQLAIDRLEQRLQHALNQAGLNRWHLSLLQSNQLWETTQRAQNYGDELMSVKLRSGAKMRLSATAEEQITNIMHQRLQGRAVHQWMYQIGTKWRDEIRARGGLLRGREFRMMDAYHFVESEEQMLELHHQGRDTLVSFLQSLGCQVRIEQADCGEIGGQMSEEIQVATSLDESGWLEVGHCFALGQKYSEAFKFKSRTNDYVWMGCQGLGTTRLLAVLLEARRQNRSLIGDGHYSVVDHVVVKLGKSEQTQEKALALYQKLKAQGGVVVMEDRSFSAGQALSASETLGARERWVISDRLGDQIEHTDLSKKTTEILS